MASRICFCTSVEYARVSMSSSAESAMMFAREPARSAPTVTEACCAESISRETIVYSRITIKDARTTGSTPR